ncbi:MAG: MBL fold metallo-hydrolase [Solirubrobacteraceae bacterium]
MRITVLGKSPAWQDAGGACSGYLVQEGGTSLLLDCGSGVFAKLRERIDYCALDAVVITHMHADHFFDVIPFAYALIYTPRQQPVPVAGWPGTDTPARPRLHLPLGGLEIFRTVVGAFGDRELVEKAFAVSEYEPDDVIDVEGLAVRFRRVPHYIATHATEVRAPDGARFVFGADSRPNDAIVEFADGADLLMLESTLPRPERQGLRGHLTPGEAGDHGRRAAAKRLVITHVSDELDLEWAQAEATKTYGAPAEVAADGAVYEL